MAPKSQSIFPSNTFSVYGKNVEIMRKLLYIPFKWDRARQELVVPTSREQALAMRVQKWILVLIVVANIILPTIGHIRHIAKSSTSVLQKLLDILQTLIYFGCLQSLFILFRECQGIPMVVNNLKRISPKVLAGEGQKPAPRKGLTRLLTVIPVMIAFSVVSRTLPILWKPQNPQYLTSLLDDAANCNIFLRILIGAYHCYGAGLNAATILTALASALVCCDTTVETVREIRQVDHPYVHKHFLQEN